MSAIPTRAATLTRNRYAKRCARCGMQAGGGATHHRRGRAVIDSHTQCPCNLVWLCTTCHSWVHAQPLLARNTGFIVSRYCNEPSNIPIVTPWGIRLHDCRGVSL